MKLSKRTKETIGISMLVSAISLVVTFLVLSARKRSFLQALLILAAAEGTAAGLLLADRAGKLPDVKEVKARLRKKSAEEEEAAPTEEETELFDEQTGSEAEAEIKEVLGGWREEENAAPRARREVPRDEEATEQDFQ